VKFAVVAYPNLRDADRAWIEAIRAKHDPQAGLIGAHFTLVYPLELSDPTSLATHIHDQIAGARPFPFKLRHATVFVDGGAYCFLEPGQGRRDLLALYDRLQDGPLDAVRHKDESFRPHITVARHTDEQVCRRLSDEINSTKLTISGRIDGIDLIQVLEDQVSTIERITFHPTLAPRGA